MRLGIIILYQGEQDPLEDHIDKVFINCLDDVEVCLVNNTKAIGSADRLSANLADLQNFNVLQMRKSKSAHAAIRAGARFMYSQFPFEHLVQVSCQSVEEIFAALKMVKSNHRDILEWSHSRNSNASRRLTQFQRIFALSQFFETVTTSS